MEDSSIKYVILQVIVSVFGVIGNIIVISIILILREHQKSVTHWYVLNLALADTLFLITLPLRAYETTQDGEWKLPESLCKAKEVILFLNYYSSVFFLVVMSVDRYIAVCHTFSKPLQKLRNRISAFITTFLVWSLSLILCIPVIMSVFTLETGKVCKCEYDFNVLAREQCKYKLRCGETPDTMKRPDHCTTNNTQHSMNAFNEEGSFAILDHQSDNGSNYEDHYSSEYGSSYYDNYDLIKLAGAIEPNCDYFLDPLGFRAFLIFNFAAMFICPLIIMVVCYGLIVQRLKNSNLAPQQISLRDSTKKKRKTSSSRNNRKRVTVMCATLVSSFIICWLPYHAVHLAKIAGIDQTKTVVCETLGGLGSLLGFLNSALNPYLYSFMGTNFARRWKSANRSFKKSLRNRQASTTSLVPRTFSKKRSRGSSNSNSRPAFVKKPSK